MARSILPILSWYSTKCCSCIRQDSRRYNDFVTKSNNRIRKEMDLQKFLHRQRFMVTSLLGLLKGRQSIFVDYFSQLLVHESSEMGFTSSD